MLEVPLYDKDGNQIEKVQIEEDLFGKKPNLRLLRDIIIQYEANKRVGTADTKRRGEVSGSSRKPWKQKHTGRARIGTIRSPLWRHGGIIFGPHPRDYSCKMPKKMRNAALDSALLSKFMDNQTLIVTDLSFESLKTKSMATLLKKLNLKETCLVGIKENNKDIHRISRNIEKIHLCPIKDFNAYDVLKYKKLLLTKDALDALIQTRRSKGE